jgi:hypothetical protein
VIATRGGSGLVRLSIGETSEIHRELNSCVVHNALQNSRTLPPYVAFKTFAFCGEISGFRPGETQHSLFKKLLPDNL